MIAEFPGALRVSVCECERVCVCEGGNPFVSWILRAAEALKCLPVLGLWATSAEGFCSGDRGQVPHLAYPTPKLLSVLSCFLYAVSCRALEPSDWLAGLLAKAATWLPHIPH